MGTYIKIQHDIDRYLHQSKTRHRWVPTKYDMDQHQYVARFRCVPFYDLRSFNWCKGSKQGVRLRLF